VDRVRIPRYFHRIAILLTKAGARRDQGIFSLRNEKKGERESLFFPPETLQKNSMRPSRPQEGICERKPAFFPNASFLKKERFPLLPGNGNQRLPPLFPASELSKPD